MSNINISELKSVWIKEINKVRGRKCDTIVKVKG